MTVRAGTAADAPRALEIWRAAVDATHRFLNAEDRAALDGIVAAMLPQAPLTVIEDASGAVAGFMILDGDRIEALFVDPAAHGRGFGGALIAHALACVDQPRVDANEQASNALPFYLAKGFVQIGRSDLDDAGRPYPIVHLRYAGAAA